MTRIPSVRALAVLVLCAPLLAACGGGGDAGDGPLSRAAYVKAASAACTDAARATAKAQVPVDLPGLAAYARVVEGVGQRLSDRLGDLRPPAADAKKHAALHAATEEATHAAGQLADA
ncbi:MAG TPA: hypothetical protein VN238_09410, partial [Solirubrobacteraceae bacterium]|nr:hypothetical protein [Solirubrobacteraceae bacterium]